MTTERTRPHARKADGTFAKTSTRSVSESPTRTKNFVPELRAPSSPRSEHGIRLFSDVVASSLPPPSQEVLTKLVTGLEDRVEDVPTNSKGLFMDSEPEDPEREKLW